MNWRRCELPPSEEAPLSATDPLIQRTLRLISTRLRSGSRLPIEEPLPPLPPLEECWIPELDAEDLPPQACSAGQLRDLLLEPARAELLACFAELLAAELEQSPGELTDPPPAPV